MFRHPHTTQNDDVLVGEKFILFDASFVEILSHRCIVMQEARDALSKLQTVTLF